MAIAKVAMGADGNTTLPPLVDYNDNDMDNSTGDPIVILLPTDGEDMSAMEEYSDDDNDLPKTIDDDSEETELPFLDSSDRIINGFYARNGWFPIKARIFSSFGSSGVGK